MADYTRQTQLYGQNHPEILDKFLQYAHLCRDPLNIFKYMEDKAICLHLPQFWLSYSETYAEMGHFKNAYLCLKEALSRRDTDQQSQSGNQFDFQKQLQNLKQKIICAMKRKPNKKSID